jgi:hypothetical protein
MKIRELAKIKKHDNFDHTPAFASGEGGFFWQGSSLGKYLKSGHLEVQYCRGSHWRACTAPYLERQPDIEKLLACHLLDVGHVFGVVALELPANNMAGKGQVIGVNCRVDARRVLPDIDHSAFAIEKISGFPAQPRIL